MKPTTFLRQVVQYLEPIEIKLQQWWEVELHEIDAPHASAFGGEWRDVPTCDDESPRPPDGWRPPIVTTPASAWRPIDTAPHEGIVLLLVEHAGERRVFVAEESSSINGPYWMTTTGWSGWSRLHGGWTPIGWQPLPPAGPVDQAITALATPPQPAGGQ